MNAAQIVLIEDNPADIMLINLALKETGIAYKLTSFPTGRDALAFLCPPDGEAANALKPDLIFLDLNTPKSDGFEILMKLRQSPQCANVPVAIISSSPLGDKGPVLSGINRYIQKPSNLNEFLSSIGQAVKEMLVK
ncbi:MAG: response regulator [Acidobacteriota bacterium]|nr:response regulator [Acidobacteriota bacterium]